MAGKHTQELRRTFAMGLTHVNHSSSKFLLIKSSQISKLHIPDPETYFEMVRRK